MYEWHILCSPLRCCWAIKGNDFSRYRLNRWRIAPEEDSWLDIFVSALASSALRSCVEPTIYGTDLAAIQPHFSSA